MITLLTNDSIGYWKQEYYYNATETRYGKRTYFIMFYKDGRCEDYAERNPPFKITQGNYGALRWSMDTDSTFSMFCFGSYKVLYHSQDTIIVQTKNSRELHRFTRSKEKWLFDKASIRYRDSLDIIYTMKGDPCIIY